MKEGLCEANPVMATNDPTRGMPARDRVLADSEIRAVWNACQDDDFGAIIRAAVAVDRMPSRKSALKWSEVDLDTGVMTIPGSRTKNHRTWN
jgi:integrase